MNGLLRSSCFQTESSITANVKVKRLPSGGSAETGSCSECALANLSSSRGGEAARKSLQRAKKISKTPHARLSPRGDGGPTLRLLFNQLCALFFPGSLLTAD